jgi:hypothetical protein
MNRFQNPQIKVNSKQKYAQLYAQFPTIDKKWTPIKQKNVEIQISSNPSHVITRIQFPIQLAARCTIHRAQGLTLDQLAFNSTSVTKEWFDMHIIISNSFKRMFTFKNLLKNRNNNSTSLEQFTLSIITQILSCCRKRNFLSQNDCKIQIIHCMFECLL